MFKTAHLRWSLVVRILNPVRPFRSTVARIHRWVGLGIGLAIVYLATTGLTLLFRPQIEPLIEARLHDVTSCAVREPLDSLIASAHTAHPAGAIRQLEIAQGGFGATIVRYNDNVGIYVDPCTGSVLGSQERWGGVFGTLEKLHRLRFLGNTDLSETIVGSVSLTMAMMVIGGLIIWWPRTRHQWKNAPKLRLGLRGLALELHLHRTLGSYAAIILLATSFASLTFVFDWARNIIYTVTASAAPAKKPSSTARAGTMPPMESFLARILSTVPQADAITILYPRKPGDAVEALIIERNAPHPNARTMLYLDAFTAEPLRFEPYAASSAGHKTYRWLASLHMGYVGGVFGQLLLFLAILTLPVLAYTGIRSWLRRRALPVRSVVAPAK